MRRHHVTAGRHEHDAGEYCCWSGGRAKVRGQYAINACLYQGFTKKMQKHRLVTHATLCYQRCFHTIRLVSSVAPLRCLEPFTAHTKYCYVNTLSPLPHMGPRVAGNDSDITRGRACQETQTDGITVAGEYCCRSPARRLLANICCDG